MVAVMRSEYVATRYLSFLLPEPANLALARANDRALGLDFAGGGNAGQCSRNPSQIKFN